MSNSTRIGLKFWHADSAGKKGRELLVNVNTAWFHHKTGHLYTITGIGFDSQRERWVYHYRRYDNPGPETVWDDDNFDFHHLPEDFHLEGRFLKVNK